MISFKVLEKREGKENTANVDGRKAKEENLELAEGKCLKGFWLSALNATGEIFNQFPMKVIFLIVKFKRTSCKPKKKYFSETWILPSAVLLATVAYAVLAFVFYNNNG